MRPVRVALPEPAYVAEAWLARVVLPEKVALKEFGPVPADATLVPTPTSIPDAIRVRANLRTFLVMVMPPLSSTADVASSG
jgi:hypothetical protein